MVGRTNESSSLEGSRVKEYVGIITTIIDKAKALMEEARESRLQG